MKTRERFQAVMNFRPFDRLPVVEWAHWWPQTIERWHGEGLPESLTDRYEICRHFGLDIYLQEWFQVSRPGCPKPQYHGSSIIATESDYDAVRKYLYPSNPVDNKKWESWARKQQGGDVVLWFSFDGFFWFPRKLFGIERHLYAFYDQPGLMHRINADLTEWILSTLDQLGKICTPDFMTFGEDMSYNHGPMISKDLFDEFMAPYYKKVIPRLKERHIIPIIDSDGNIAVPAYWFEEAGLEGILPLERQAGVDIAGLRKEHPRLRFIGHFDKMTMDKGEAVMRAEFERLVPTAAKGGLIISCDHQTPPGVSYQDYLLYIRLFKEYAEKTGQASTTKLRRR